MLVFQGRNKNVLLPSLIKLFKKELVQWEWPMSWSPFGIGKIGKRLLCYAQNFQLDLANYVKNFFNGDTVYNP